MAGIVLCVCVCVHGRKKLKYMYRTEWKKQKSVIFESSYHPSNPSSSPVELNGACVFSEMSDYSDKVDRLKCLVLNIPPPSHDTLHFIFSHLQR